MISIPTRCSTTPSHPSRAGGHPGKGWPPRQLAGLLLLAALGWSLPVSPQELIPLSDLGADTYLGWQGGLYPGGSNEPPRALAALVATAASEITPRDRDGNPSADGLIGFLAVGMSNTNQEFRRFERAADQAPERDPRLVIVDTAVGGKAVEAWLDPEAGVWEEVGSRLRAAGLAASQVQIAWMKQIHNVPPTQLFPEHAEILKADLGLLVERLAGTFPNLKLIYVANRIYGGYQKANPSRDEPFTYETGFAMKWLIAEQPALLGNPEIRPILLWGTDLWANGEVPRSDGLVWNPQDLEADGVHPSAAGEAKVAAWLGETFRCRAPWWAGEPGLGLVALDAVADAAVTAARPDQNLGSAPVLSVRGVAPVERSYLRFDLGPLAGRSIHHAKLSLLNEDEVEGRVEIRRTDGGPWSEQSITFANAPGAGILQGSFATASRDGSLQADLTAAVAAAAGGVLDLVLSSVGEGREKALARESGEPPRLIVSIRDGSVFRGSFECGDLRAWSRAR